VQVRPRNFRLVKVRSYYVRLGRLVKVMHGSDRLGKILVTLSHVRTVYVRFGLVSSG
jgi:hypothetical protein